MSSSYVATSFIHFSNTEQLRQEDYAFKASLGYITSPVSKNKMKQQQKDVLPQLGLKV
jgi:hypothetical protein